MRNIFVILLFPLILFSQKDIQFTHLSYVQEVFNPAIASYDGSYRAVIIARQQWFNFQGAPQTQMVSFSFPYQKKWGFSAQLLHDRLGFENNFMLTTNGAYFFPLTIRENDYRIGIGLASNFYLKRLEGSKLIYDDMSDPNGVFTDVTRFHADLNAGLTFSGKNFLTAISTRNVISVPKSKQDIFKYNRYFYIFASYDIRMNEHVTLSPFYFAKTNFQLYEHNIQVAALFENAFKVGLNYRHKESLGIMLGIKFLKNWEIAYAYDLIVGSINQVSFGSHDMVLSYQVKPLPPKPPYIKSPRYFN